MHEAKFYKIRDCDETAPIGDYCPCRVCREKRILRSRKGLTFEEIISDRFIERLHTSDRESAK